MVNTASCFKGTLHIKFSHYQARVRLARGPSAFNNCSPLLANARSAHAYTFRLPEGYTSAPVGSSEWQLFLLPTAPTKNSIAIHS